MRFERIRIDHFGRLDNFRSGTEPLGSLVGVHGPNEAGKSTLFTFLTSLLYGIYPTRREEHPYAPWEGHDLQGEAEIRLADGRVATVQRRLLSSPLGELRIDGTVDRLANRTVPWAGHVPRDLFRRVYALTLQDLTGLEGETWREVQDRLLGALGAEDVRPVRKVVEELEKEAAKLWRADRRGSPAADALQGRRRELLKLRKAALDRDEELRRKVMELGETEEELDRAREERIRIEARADRADRLRPVRETLLIIAREEERMGASEKIEDLPDDPAETLESLEGDVSTRRDRAETIEGRAEEARKHVSAFSEEHRRVLAQGTEIRNLAKEAGEIGFATTRLQKVRGEREKLSRRCEELARELLTAPWGESVSTSLVSFPTGELRQRVRQYREARSRVSDRNARLEALRDMEPSPDDGGVPWIGVALTAGGSLLLLSLLLGGVPAWDPDPATLGIPGVVLLVAGLVMVGSRLAEGRTRVADAARHERALEWARGEAEEAAEAARERLGLIVKVLEPIPVAPAHLEAPDLHLVQGLEKLQEAGRDLRTVLEEEERLERTIREGEERLSRVAEAVEVPVPEELRRGVVVLEEALHEAEGLRGEAQRAREALREIEEELAEVRGLLTRDEERLKRLRARLTELGEGDPEAGLEEARRRLEARDRVRHLKERLASEHLDLDRIRAEIRAAEEAGESWTVEDEGLARDRDRIRRLNEREKELREGAAEIRKEVEALRADVTADALDGEIESVEEELADLRRRRDRLCVLAELLRAADHRFREENQPDLIRRASAHLARITADRYERIWLREGDLDGTLLLRGPGYPEALEVSHRSVSTGTREQVYLALRLAIVDHLDDEAETLPLFIDEAFVNWDSDRRDRGLDLLEDLSRRRQVFVFTCHPELSRELESRGGTLLHLPGA